MSSRTSLPIAHIPSVIAASAMEQESERLEFRGRSARPGASPGPESSSADADAAPTLSATHADAERRSERGQSDRLDEQLKVGRVMNALFPAGVQITSAEQFATLRLFTAMVASVTQFARSDMSNSGAVRDVKRQAEMLDELAGLTPR